MHLIKTESTVTAKVIAKILFLPNYKPENQVEKGNLYASELGK